MAIRIVRLGSPRSSGEGVRLGTVRRPPRGVPKHEFASRDFYDVWLPILSPSDDLLREFKASLDERAFERFARKFRSEMRKTDSTRTLDLLTALSYSTQMSLGCYCADESRCHRSLLRQMLLSRGADVYHELSAGHAFRGE